MCQARLWFKQSHTTLRATSASKIVITEEAPPPLSKLVSCVLRAVVSTHQPTRAAARRRLFAVMQPGGKAIQASRQEGAEACYGLRAHRAVPRGSRREGFRARGHGRGDGVPVQAPGRAGESCRSSLLTKDFGTTCFLSAVSASAAAAAAACCCM